MLYFYRMCCYSIFWYNAGGHLHSVDMQSCCLNPQLPRITGQWQPKEVPLCILYVTRSNDVSAQTEQPTLTADWWFSKSGARALHSHTVSHSPLMINGERGYSVWCREGRGDAGLQGEGWKPGDWMLCTAFRYTLATATWQRPLGEREEQGERSKK